MKNIITWSQISIHVLNHRKTVSATDGSLLIYQLILCNFFLYLFTHCLHHFVVNDHASEIIMLSVDHHHVIRAALSEQVVRQYLRKTTNVNKSA